MAIGTPAARSDSTPEITTIYHQPGRTTLTMAASPIRWLESHEFGKQIAILAAIFDPIGAVLGYALHPVLGVDAVFGVAIGLFAASWVMSAWIVRHVLTRDDESTRAESL